MSVAPSRGRMLWFNSEKGHGYIRTSDDERLYVAANGFPEGHPPSPCSGLLVEFEIVQDGGGRSAANARVVDEPQPRRARRRHTR